MGCCINNSRTSITLTFLREQLLYDVRNYSFVEGDIMQAPDEHARHQVFDVGEDGNVDRVTRVLNLAHAECVEMLHPFAVSSYPSDNDILDDILIEPEKYSIDLSIPSAMPLSKASLLEHLIHEYLVCRVLSDWMSITNPASEKNWEKKMEDIKSKITSCLISARVTKIRRRISPF